MKELADHGHLTVGDASLEYRMIGPRPGAAPTIVMLHEGLGSVTTWGDFPQKVAEHTGAGVFVYSRAGYGRSSTIALPRPLDYMQREATEVLPRLLDAIGFRRGILFGHSDGATIAAWYGGSVQDHRVRGLILMAPHFFMESSNVEAIQKTVASYETTDLRAKLARHHADVDTAFRGWSGAWLDPGFNRVLQATGRVIRTEADRGSIVLIDERFTQVRYRQLFPAHWRGFQVIQSTGEIKNKLERFWSRK